MNTEKIPFLCVITPVFDPAYDSILKLISELKSQTYGQFIHIMISNGPSSAIKNLVMELNKEDRRFIYDEIPEENLNGSLELLINLGKRREYCLKKYNAERYVFLDADVKLIDDNYFLKLYEAHQKVNRDILITLIKIIDQGKEVILPIFPITCGHIDMANFTFSKNIAKSFSYPTDYDLRMGIANDFRFFSKISNENNTAIFNFISAIRDGNNSYKRLTELFLEEQKSTQIQRKPNPFCVILEKLRNFLFSGD
jgi:hypothetical protein